MAARNPLRNHFKQGSNARDVKQELRKVTGDCKKEARAALVIRKRNIELQDGGKPQGTKVDKRKEQMLAWKAARDKQRKIDAIKNKKDHGFVVKHVMHSPAKYLVSERTTNGTKKGSKQEQKQTDKPSRRITRSCTNNMRKIQIESKVDKKSTPTKIPAPVANKGATPRSEERRPTRVCTRNKGDNKEKSDPEDVTKSATEGFNFHFNPEAIMLKTFNFCTEPPALKFSNAKMASEVPAAKFDDLHENGSNASSIQVSAGLEQSQIEVVNPTANFNVPSRSVNEPKTEDNSISGGKRESVIATVCSDKRDKENIEDEKEVEIIVAKGCPGKTPKRHNTLPKHMVQIMDEERFTPRRIQSTSHFRRLVAGEREKFDNMNAVWTTYLNENELKEEICGRIRTVIGQAQLLMDQRFKQFEELITLHQSKISEKGATAADLQGFWDMVDYQVQDVHKKFAELETWKNNDWEIEKPKKATKIRKVVEKKPKDVSKATAARQEATRKFKQAMRAKLQAAKSQSDADLDVQIVAGDRKSENETSAMSTSIVPPGNEGSKQDHRIRSSSGEMSGDSLEGGSRQIKMSPLKNNSSFNIKLCTALERIDLKNTEENKELEGKENFSSPPKKANLRRSMRKTPSKYKTPNKQDDAWTTTPDKKQEDVTCNLFVDSTNAPEDDCLLAKYLRPSTAGEEYDDLFGLGISSLKKERRRKSEQPQDISLIKFD